MTGLVARDPDDLVKIINGLTPFGMGITFSKTYDPPNQLWINAHEQIEAAGELEAEISGIARKGLTEGFTGSPLWINHHQQIKYQGATIDVKYPTALGLVSIFYIRWLGDMLWNQGYAVLHAYQASAKRENAKIKRLRRKHIPTYRSLQYLIEDDKGRYRCKRVLLTRYIKGTRNLVKILNDPAISDQIKLKYISMSGYALKILHVNKESFSDPTAENVSVFPNNYGGDLFLHGFGLRSSNLLDFNRKCGSEIINYIVTLVKHSKLPEDDIVKAFVDGYPDINEVRPEIIMARNYHRYHLKHMPRKLLPVRNFIYDNLVFGLPAEHAMAIKDKVVKQIS